jgi:hypothetical protein
VQTERKTKRNGKLFYKVTQISQILTTDIKQPTAGNFTKLTMAGTATAFRSLMLFQKSHRLSKLSAVPLESSCIIFDDVASPTISKNLSGCALPIGFRASGLMG